MANAKLHSFAHEQMTPIAQSPRSLNYLLIRSIQKVIVASLVNVLLLQMPFVALIHRTIMLQIQISLAFVPTEDGGH
jgi:hypothetical protein